MIKAKPLDWSFEGHKEWHDKRCGFYISYGDSESPSVYSATWGEDDPETFATLEEAMAWCQEQIDQWLNTVAEEPDAAMSVLRELVAAERGSGTDYAPIKTGQPDRYLSAWAAAFALIDAHQGEPRG